jgi:acyl-CoA thioester hydrolase
MVAFYLHPMNYAKQVEIRWSDLDPNFHLRHSVYYDFGAYCRVCFLDDNGITSEIMTKHFIGPILFREECLFKREIKFGDRISINLKMKSITANGKKWAMKHELLKDDNIVCAIITIEGAWMNTQLRKIIAPPEIFMIALEKMPKTEDFQIL